jgi:hypothetical protein
MKYEADIPSSQISSVVVDKQRTTRRVRFQVRVDTCTLPSPLDVMESSSNNNSRAEVKRMFWYDLSDIQTFRQEARILCQQMRMEIPILSPNSDSAGDDKNDLQTQIQQTASSSHVALDDEYTRGLELYSCLERKRRRHLANKYILRAASELALCEAEKLASVSRQLSLWASTLAIEEADRDYHQAWRPSPKQMTMKRLSEEEERPERNVRSRTLV